MQLFSSNTVDMNPLMAILGLYFQIRDDYANLNLKEVKLFLIQSTFFYLEKLHNQKFYVKFVTGIIWEKRILIRNAVSTVISVNLRTC